MPASSVAVDIAEAMLATLEGVEFSQEYTADRRYVVNWDVEELTGVEMSIVPQAQLVTNQDRTRNSNEVSVDVGIQVKVDGITPEHVDPYMVLAQEVMDHFSRRALPDLPAAKFMRVGSKVIFSPAHLDQKRTFTSVVTVTYRLAKP